MCVLPIFLFNNETILYIMSADYFLFMCVCVIKFFLFFCVFFWLYLFYTITIESLEEIIVVRAEGRELRESPAGSFESSGGCGRIKLPRHGMGKERG